MASRTLHSYCMKKEEIPNENIDICKKVSDIFVFSDFPRYWKTVVMFSIKNIIKLPRNRIENVGTDTLLMSKYFVIKTSLVNKSTLHL